MSPDERQQLERRVERAVRRGELGDAAAMLRELVAAFPGEASLADKLTHLEANLEPSERQVASAPFHSEASSTFATPQHEAEALAARGDFAGAVALYRRLVTSTPSAALMEERLAELYQLARASHPIPSASRAQLLEHLLERITTRRR